MDNNQQYGPPRRGFPRANLIRIVPLAQATRMRALDLSAPAAMVTR